MTSPLLPSLPLKEGETLTGYVSRSAKLYETTVRDFCSDLGMRWPYLCSGHDDQIERLAWLIGKRPENLRAFTSGKVEIGRFRFGKTMATFGALRRTAARFCPRCVADALARTGLHGICQMQEWAVTSLYSCPHHRCLLMTLPASQHAHTAYDFVTRITDHMDEVLQASRSPRTVSPAPFENYIRERIWQGPKDDWLKDFDLTQIHRVCLNLGAAIEGLKVKAMMSLHSERERSLCQLGFEYVAIGPDGFKAALERMHQQSSTERPYFSSDMGPFYQWLREFYDEPALTPLVDLTCSHIFETYPTPTGREIFDRVAPEQTLLTMNEARKISGFGVTFLKKLLGHMNGVDEAESLLRTDVHVDELAKAKAYWDKLINLKDATWMLGLSGPQIKSLQALGAIDMIKITSSLRYVLRSQVTELLEKLDALPPSLPDRSVVPLREFCHLKQVSIVQIIDLWVRGKLEGRLCRGEGIGLQSIEVDWDFLSQRTLIDLIGDLTAEETARYLKVNVAGIRRLRDAGYLEEISRRNPDTNHCKRYITKQSIAAFEQQYVTLGRMANGQGIRPIHLAQRLDRDGVAPINCSAGPVRVYAIDVLDGGCNHG